MLPLDLVKLTALMDASTGRAETIIGLIDEPVALNHPDLMGGKVREISGKRRGACARANSIACMHGTFIAGMLSAKRDSPAPAICPDCTLLVRPIFAETSSGKDSLPSATPETVAAAIVECIAPAWSRNYRPTTAVENNHQARKGQKMKPITGAPNIPGFTAEAALRQTNESYQMAEARPALADGRQVVPQFCYSPRPGLHCCWTPWLGWRCLRFHDVA